MSFPAARAAYIILQTVLLALPFAVFAEDVPVAPPPAEMETVTVTGLPEDLLSGSHTLSGATLQQLPLKNGSIAEAVTLLPNVQAGEAQRTSEQGGEILPPLISISGARPYENYYSIDGIGLNSLLDPLSDNIFKADAVPGHPQRIFIHRDLIESIEVYDSNVPARYGQFLGGVIDAKTRNPATTFGGVLRYRTTRDAWTEQHIDASREEDFENSRYSDQQPKYEKHDGGVEFDLPISPSMGLLAAYNRTESSLELSHIGEDKTQQKSLENFFLKLLWTPDANSSLTVTGTYTPSGEDFFYENTKDSDLTIKRGGYSLNTAYATRLADGDLTFSAAWLESENSRTAPNNYYTWARTPSKDWGSIVGTTYSFEGGFGDLDTSESSLQLKADYLFDPVRLGSLTHAVGLGVAYTRDEGEYDRREPYYTYILRRTNPAVCIDGDPTCVVNEQYFYGRNLYSAQDSSAVVHRQAYYVDDQISVGRVTLRPGLRVSHDDFLNNTDVAHRLAGNWDIFGNGTTNLIAGLNRYYGEALLTYKLREAIPSPFRQERATPLDPWLTTRLVNTTLNKYSSLETPYSDEFTVGIDQKLLGGALSLNYLDRRHRDQFARETITENGQNYYVLNNNGSSDYESWSVGWERQWQKHYLNVNYTYADSESTNELYDTSLSDETLADEVWYEGRFMTRDELPRTDYYRPHVVNIIYVGKFPLGFTFTNVAKYQSGYEALTALSLSERIARGIPDPKNVVAYDMERRSGAWIFDWRLDWEQRLYRDQSLLVSLEVNNVFDRKVETGGTTEDIYELGREFWLGMAYRF